MIKDGGERMVLRVARHPEVSPGRLPGEGGVAGGSKDVSPIAQPLGVSGVCCKTWLPISHSSSCSGFSLLLSSLRLTCE